MLSEFQASLLLLVGIAVSALIAVCADLDLGLIRWVRKS